MNTNTITTFRAGDTDFTRTRKLPFWRVAVLILRGWKTSFQNRINKFFDDLGLLENIPTASAFCQAREKIKPAFFKALNENVTKFFYENSDTAETKEKYSIQDSI